ncbi:MAG: Gfo/Idh/MocA family oxidoreductase [Roseiflexaceae bacterium]|nr:Gfo/Idh/MocA family oxidoreductase [Roseiflexaceae bacterium]
MSQQKLRIGIIGVGMFASYFHVPQLRATGRAEIVAICRRNQEQLAIASDALGVAATYTDWRTMFDSVDLDAVVVSTPHHYHVEPTMAALERGLHVLVDKPMALAGREAWAMVAAAERTKRILMVAYATRAEQGLRWLKRQLDAGIIGQIRQISCSMTTYRRWFWQADAIPPDVMDVVHSVLSVPDAFHEGWQDWHRDPAQMGGGTFPDIGIYSLDLVLWLAGAPAVEVVAFTENAGLPVECFINSQARLANGVLLSLNFADAAPQPIISGERQLMIVGEQGTIMDDSEGQFWLHQHGERTRLVPDEPETTIAEAFVASILDGKPNLSPAEQGANVVDFMEAMYRSAAEQRIVRIEPNF